MRQDYPIVYMDERGFGGETIRPYDYAPRGKQKKRTNIIVTLHKKMQFALDCFEQNINNNIFYDWCKFTLISSLKTKCVIVMDINDDKAKHCFARAQGESYA